ncbi:MAG: hypothetical protein DRP01_05405 [Archaeoglobales archaeon]|nr:MAG: hypothetical protein DRP01_05405 [Archaeoglobales archaeon]
MKRIVESGIKIVDRSVGGFPIPSLITVVVDPLATPELLIYSMCDYYVPRFKDPKSVLRESEVLGYKVEVTDYNGLKSLKRVRVCLEFGDGIDEVIRLKEIAYRNELILNLIVLKDYYEKSEISKILHVSDGIMFIESEKVGERFVFRFAIPRMIGGLAIPNYIRFKTERSVLEIDTSRDVV